MRLSREQARERTVDYLYGGLAGEELRAFEAALGEFDDVAREVDALRQTLGLARESLKLSEQAAPSRARAAILAAARSESALRAKAEPQARERATAPRQDFWSWLRSPWLFPAFGVCAAIAFVVLRVRDERNNELASAPTSTAQPAEPTAEVEAPAAPAAVTVEERASGKGSAGGAAPTTSPKRRSERSLPEERSKLLARRSSRSEPFPGAPSGEVASRPVPRRAEPAKSAPASNEDDALLAAEPFPSQAAEQATAEREARAQAASAARAAAAAAPQAVAPAADRAVTGGAVAESSRARKSERYASEAPSAPAAAPEGGGTLGTRAGAEAKRATDTEEKRVTARVDPAAQLATRAAEAYKAGRYRDAVALYRELLGRLPQDPRAPTWRNELRRSERALAARDH